MPSRFLPILVLVAALSAAGRAGSVELAGVEFADRLETGDVALQLHGVGLLRTRWLLDGYVAALYLRPGVAADRALDDVPRRLEIEYFWSIPARAFADATREGIARNVDPAALDRLQERIERMNALYADVRPGDRYALTYLPGVGTELALNDERRGVIEGAEFSRALFGIWLGSAPLDAGLRRQLLSSSPGSGSEGAGSSGRSAP